MALNIMKPVVVFLIGFMLHSLTIYGQEFTFARNTNEAFRGGYLLQSSRENSRRYHLCSESRVGFGITAAGIVTGCVGIAVLTAHAHMQGTGNNEITAAGAGIWVVGGAVAILGSVLAIDGSIHDLRRYNKARKLSMYSPNGHQLGIACNF